MTYSFSDAEFLQLQYADLQSVLEILVFELHGPRVCGHILCVRRWAVRACVIQQESSTWTHLRLCDFFHSVLNT